MKNDITSILHIGEGHQHFGQVIWPGAKYLGIKDVSCIIIEESITQKANITGSIFADKIASEILKIVLIKKQYGHHQMDGERGLTAKISYMLFQNSVDYLLGNAQDQVFKNHVESCLDPTIWKENQSHLLQNVTNSLPTREVLNNTHFPDQGVCPNYKTHKDTIAHAIYFYGNL